MKHLLDIADRIDRGTKALGTLAGWMICFMGVVQVGAVIFRFVFGVNLLFVQDTVLYLHALIFLLGAAGTLAVNGHVRVDLFYRDLSARRKALVDCLGLGLLLIPFCVTLLIYALPYITASWRFLEGARETTGLHLVFLLKSGIALFALLLILQGLSGLIRRIAFLRGGAE